MLDLRAIREDPDGVRLALARRGEQAATGLEEVIALDLRRREILPQLEGLRFSHQWGGAIDTCTRFCAFFGTAHQGDVAYALGYTGLGVGATRFGAQVMLDLLGGVPTPLTSLDMVRSTPLPIPPEPLPWNGIQLMRRSLARADDREGRRDLLLRLMDRVGIGYDS